MNKSELLESLQEISFAMDELRLYLDTHPKDDEALLSFYGYMNKREELLKQYTENYGPMYSYFVNTKDGWTWSDTEVWKGEK